MMDKILELLEREDGCLSIGRICALLSFALWFIATVFLIATALNWQGYDTLTIAAVGMLLAQVCNKAIDCRIFSVKSEQKSGD